MPRRKKQSRSSLVAVGVLAFLVGVPLLWAAVDAPTGFVNETNGFESQTDFDRDREQFKKIEDVPDGLGPVYNAQACSVCHSTPLAGSSSQVTELRAGQTDSAGNFTPHPGGSLINDRAIDPNIQEHVWVSDNVRAFRVSLNLRGDGFVEALPDSEFTRIRNAQPVGMKGIIVSVPVLEASSSTTTVTRTARFGWKNQHASLLSFAADAYLNEMGITNPLFPTENTHNGASVAAFDNVADPEDAPTTDHPFGPDVEAFTRFMRATDAPSRRNNPPSSTDVAGEAIFDNIGCANCHTDSITTAPSGTSFNGGTFIVPAALGSKTIHPYGDFMLHDIGTGDGIVQEQTSGALIRTAPLWGLRVRTRLMHDGLSLTSQDAILRHAGQAAPVIANFNALSDSDRQTLIAFLNSL